MHTDVMSFVLFQVELRRASRFCPRPLAADPLAAALLKIERNPAHTQSRLLMRILAALTHQEGDFRRAEASTLDADCLAIAVTLMEAKAAGTILPEEWTRAVATARAAICDGAGTVAPACDPPGTPGSPAQPPATA